MTRTTDFVVPLEDKPYLQWQARVLLHSFERWRRPGQRVFFVVVGDERRISRYLRGLLEDRRAPFATAPVPDVLDIAKNPGKLAHQSFNKPYGLARLVERRDVELADDLFVMDPDLIFLRAFDLEGWPGWLRATHVRFPGAKAWDRHMARVLEITGVRREAINCWDGAHPVDVGAEWLAPASDWRELAPLWEDLSLKLQTAPELRADFGWAGDVTAGSFAAWRTGRKVDAMTGVCAYNGGYRYAREAELGHRYFLHYGYGNEIFEKRNFFEGAIDRSDGQFGGVLDAVLNERAEERLAKVDRSVHPATARALEAIRDATSTSRPKREPLFTGRLPPALAALAIGTSPERTRERLDPLDPGGKALAEELAPLLRVGGAVEVEREQGGELVLLSETDDGSFVRATTRDVVVTFACPRPMAPLGEEGLRAALRRVLRLPDELRGDGLVLEDARFDRQVVYAEYAAQPTGPLGRHARRIVVWSDGTRLAAALELRCEPEEDEPDLH